MPGFRSSDACGTDAKRALITLQSRRSEATGECLDVAWMNTQRAVAPHVETGPRHLLVCARGRRSGVKAKGFGPLQELVGLRPTATATAAGAGTPAGAACHNQPAGVSSTAVRGRAGGGAGWRRNRGLCPRLFGLSRDIFRTRKAQSRPCGGCRQGLHLVAGGRADGARIVALCQPLAGLRRESVGRSVVAGWQLQRVIGSTTAPGKSPRMTS